MRILFTSTHDAAFIKEDLRILRKSHDVFPLVTLGVLSLFRIVVRVARVDLTYTWFASVYSAPVVFFAHLFRKRSVIVVGGVDAAKEASINYGIWLSAWKSLLVGYAVRNADLVLVVTPFLRDQLIRLARYHGRNIVVLPTGYDSTFWIPGGGEKERIVLTVASCENRPRMDMKGIPVLIEAARSLPDIRFTVIGPVGEAAKLIQGLNPPRNLTIVPFTPREQLLDYYQKSKVYCQPSFFEGLPNSLCEAMLCECVPVGTRVGGIPVGIGDTGFLVDHNDVDGLVSAIAEAIDASPTAGKKAREHIATSFPLSRRAELLLDLVARVYS